MKKILFFSPYFYPYTSGTTTYPLKLFIYLSNHGFKITILTFKHDPHLTDKEKFKKLKIIRMDYLFKISKGFISPQSIFYFLKEAKKTDLVILNQPNFEGLPLAILSKIFKKKIISLFHCQVFLGSGIFKKLVNAVLNFSVFIQLFLSNIIIGHTKDYLDSIFIGKIFKRKILFTLPPIEKYPVDKKFLKQIKEKQNHLIGYSGRISREKGIQYLVKVAEKLKKKKLKIKLVFAGPFGKDVVGEEKYFLKIKALLKKKGIPYSLLGNLPSKKLGAFYKAIDLLVLPSINQTEAFGMVQPEAMLLGTPVIASNIPGVRIPIKLTKMGIAVKPKNENQLAKAIEQILRNKDRYTNPSFIKKAQKIFDIKKTYQFYNQLISKL